jgi:ABC-type multidrug transport system fused ATPase/permease subunit
MIVRTIALWLGSGVGYEVGPELLPLEPLTSFFVFIGFLFFSYIFRMFTLIYVTHYAKDIGVSIGHQIYMKMQEVYPSEIMKQGAALYVSDLSEKSVRVVNHFFIPFLNIINALILCSGFIIFFAADNLLLATLIIVATFFIYSILYYVFKPRLDAISAN